jgi:hypothetical protein
MARSPAAKSSLQFLLDAPIYARSRRLCHIFEQASARQDGSQQDGAMRRYSLVLSLSFCFPFEYGKILRFKPTLPAIWFPRTTHCSTATSQGATILDL